MPTKEDYGPVFQLWNDELTLLQVLAISFESQQCENPKLSKTEFLDELGDSKDGEVSGLKNCYDAFRQEWANFFRFAKKDESKARLIEASWEAICRASELGVRKLDVIFQNEMKKLEESNG